MPTGILCDRREMTYKIITRRTFEERLGDRDYLIAAFNRHIEDVQNEISSDRLLTYDVAEGWGRFVNFWMSTSRRVVSRRQIRRQNFKNARA